ncbi:MAG: hypothetical protein ACYCWW_12275, partial [Deltaproteobacteria bacterium]
MAPPRKVLLVATARSYRTEELARAARSLGGEIELWLATDRCHVLAGLWGAGSAPGRAPTWSVPLELRSPERAAAQIAELDARFRAEGQAPWAGVMGEDDATAVVAALAAERLGLPHVSPEAARSARDKGRSRRALARAGLPVPAFALVPAG